MKPRFTELLTRLIARSVRPIKRGSGKSDRNYISEPGTEAESADVSPAELSSVSKSESTVRFIFLMSQARSGTNAFMNLMHNSSPNFLDGGEIFKGFTHPKLMSIIEPDFPWFPRLEINVNEGYHKWHASLIDEKIFSVFNLLSDAPELRGSTIFVKVFPFHLREARFAELLNTFRPEVIFLRRHLLFTFISEMKALQMGHGSWSKIDSSKEIVTFNPVAIEKHIARSDNWFNIFYSHTNQLKLPNLDITYSGLFETGDDIGPLSLFLSEISGNPVSLDIESCQLPIQDRRYDSFLANILEQFADLSEASRSALLRLPGTNF